MDKFRTTLFLCQRPTLTSQGDALQAHWEVYEAPRPISGDLLWRGPWGGDGGGWFYAAINPDDPMAQNRRDINLSMDASRIGFVSPAELKAWAEQVLLPELLVEFIEMYGSPKGETEAREYLAGASERELWMSYLDHQANKD